MLTVRVLWTLLVWLDGITRAGNFLLRGFRCYSTSRRLSACLPLAQPFLRSVNDGIELLLELLGLPLSLLSPGGNEPLLLQDLQLTERKNLLIDAVMTGIQRVLTLLLLCEVASTDRGEG